jgi:hypothetical protein
MLLPTAIAIRHVAFEDLGAYPALNALTEMSRASCTAAFELEGGQAGRNIERARAAERCASAPAPTCRAVTDSKACPGQRTRRGSRA